MSSMAPNADGASTYSTSTSIRNRFKRLVQGKTPSQLEKERALQKSKDRRKLLKELESTCKNERTDFTLLENYLNTKLAHRGQVTQRIVGSFDYSHTERRNLEIEKIAKRARRMSVSRNKRIEEHVTKHSLYDESLRRAVIESLESKKIKKKSQSYRRPSDVNGPARDGNSPNSSNRDSWQRMSLVHERISSRSTPHTMSGSRRGSDDDDEEIFLQLRRGSLSPPVLVRRGTLPSVITGRRGTLSSVPEKRGK
ncbi:unnamed protein product [Lymnaea stagnalis]|uniref:Uncharacterized protein n=1 Tax=Lymnaea stagnalis TaxID=6523 RepID=A0AAV2HLN0_LYMST